MFFQNNVQLRLVMILGLKQNLASLTVNNKGPGLDDVFGFKVTKTHAEFHVRKWILKHWVEKICSKGYLS